MIECNEVYAIMKNKAAVFLLAMSIIAAGTGCEKIKKVFVKPPPEGMVQKSYPVKVYSYQGSVNVKASPKEVVDGYFKDVSAISRASKLLKIEPIGSLVGIDMTELGQSIDFKIQVLSLAFTCRMITIKYKPEREIWWLVVTEGNWLILRYGFKPAGKGSELSLNVIGQPSKSIAAIMDNLPIIESVGGVADTALAFLQADMDPELDPKELTEKGLRGEMYEEFLQGHETSIWVDASPEKTAEWVIMNFGHYLPEMKLRGDCTEVSVFRNISREEVKYCEAGYELMSLEADLSTFFIWSEKGKEITYRVYLEGLGQFGYLQLVIAPESGGSRLDGTVMIELPGASSQHVMDTMMTLTAVPRRVGELMINIKRGAERAV